jgi:hypothetical protein
METNKNASKQAIFIDLIYTDSAVNSLTVGVGVGVWNLLRPGYCS